MAEATRGTGGRQGRRGAGHWAVLALASAALGVEAWLGLAARPDARGYGTHEQLGLAPCRAMEWFGVPCPGCGVTTSVAHAAHGEFVASFTTQPFGLLVAAALPLGVAALWYAALRGEDCSATLSRWTSSRATLLLAAAAAFGWIWKLATL